MKKKDWFLDILERASKQVDGWSNARRGAWEARAGVKLPPRKKVRKS